MRGVVGLREAEVGAGGGAHVAVDAGAEALGGRQHDAQVAGQREAQVLPQPLHHRLAEHFAIVPEVDETSFGATNETKRAK